MLNGERVGGELADTTRWRGGRGREERGGTTDLPRPQRVRCSDLAKRPRALGGLLYARCRGLAAKVLQVVSQMASPAGLSREPPHP